MFKDRRLKLWIAIGTQRNETPLKTDAGIKRNKLQTAKAKSK